MIKFQSFLSGSSGNCTLVTDDTTHLLIDCGATGRYITECLGRIGLQPNALSGILVTHEHRDHVCGAGVLARKYGVRLYTNEATFAAMRPIVGPVDEDNVEVHAPGEAFYIGDIAVCSFSIPHDASDPVGYCLRSREETFTIATDMGCLSEPVMEALRGSDYAIVEANHDVEMLRNGRYPWPLKKRILSEYGHLSNACAGELCMSLVESGVKCIWLGHLSQENNRPEVAYQTVAGILAENGVQAGRDVALGVLPRYWLPQYVRTARVS